MILVKVDPDSGFLEPCHGTPQALSRGVPVAVWEQEENP
jgi:hypothetical protein